MGSELVPVDKMTGDVPFEVMHDEGNETIENLTEYNHAIVTNEQIISNTFTRDLNEKIDSLIVRTEDRLWSCRSCGKTMKIRKDLTRHIESIHIDGLELPCNNCEKILGSRDALRSHKYRVHRAGHGF